MYKTPESGNLFTESCVHVRRRDSEMVLSRNLRLFRRTVSTRDRLSHFAVSSLFTSRFVPTGAFVHVAGYIQPHRLRRQKDD